MASSKSLVTLRSGCGTRVLGQCRSEIAEHGHYFFAEELQGGSGLLTGH